MVLGGDGKDYFFVVKAFLGGAGRSEEFFTTYITVSLGIEENLRGRLFLVTRSFLLLSFVLIYRMNQEDLHGQPPNEMRERLLADEPKLPKQEVLETLTIEIG